MAQEFIKNIARSEAVVLKDQVAYEKDQVVSLTLTQKDSLTVTLFAFDDGTGIGGHSSNGDAMVNVLEGTAIITIGGERHTVRAGESIVMPAGIPHALDAESGKFKMFLIVVKP